MYWYRLQIKWDYKKKAIEEKHNGIRVTSHSYTIHVTFRSIGTASKTEDHHYFVFVTTEGA
jgi:hypothetical protein